MKTIIAKNILETQGVAEKLIKKLKPGNILALEGDLGSGKTCFVQGIAKALGIKKIITSPTFVLLKIYPVKYLQSKFNRVNPVKSHKVGILPKAKLFNGASHVECENKINPAPFFLKKKWRWIKKLYHFDLYRIGSEKELLDLGFKEILEKKDGIIAIEWAERAQKILPAKRININFKFVDENTRIIHIDMKTMKQKT